MLFSFFFSVANICGTLAIFQVLCALHTLFHSIDQQLFEAIRGGWFPYFYSWSLNSELSQRKHSNYYYYYYYIIDQLVYLYY